MTYRILKLVLSLLVYVFLRPQVTGLHNVPRRGPVIIASNHLSFIDSIILPLVVPRHVTFIAKAEYWTGRGLKGRVSRWFFTTMGHIPVDREDPRAGQRSLEDALQVLQRGDAFGIYPEGTRSRDGRLQKGHTGVAWLALTGAAPVVPVALRGTDKVQPVGARLPRPVRGIRVEFGVPIDPSRQIAAGTRPAQARRRLTDQVMSSIHEMSGQELVA
ncbi:1-acyl-sn-glycerol-3-phosphate acyltransferase [Isoptericola sp. CG 20/1183]|uniref:1-acyl-sn-glycerol-3-phosphate acyltransferase n=1 Tax=Isoptericola halotolerans TaxID=300560 RepID=A0ABX5EGU3_9MICO|nr:MULTISPECIES: lysophospholipid acyltransferase family protein [Isoptericola]MCK0116110.1 1-acyl-sn-glycerol-3-phosphate acyltransferase [Isoptericola sp. S6320L]PRZ08712.1 1-acyl-sn-glycerol-3-phosphate acyltransferase [Isoptericola halotolerans]PRZ10841.1 1-acyl-sn-glycerol-3-phosphate acyltransferase [Isoptericola sp. CG 20/1183]